MCEAMEALGAKTMGDLRAPRASTHFSTDVIAKIGFASVAIPGAAGLLGLVLVELFPGIKLFEAMAGGFVLAPIALVTVLPCCLALSALARKITG